jgi:hypothetical protein
MDYVTLPQAAKALGMDYGKVWYAARLGAIVKPKRIGKATLLTQEQVETLRQHFGKADTMKTEGE